MRERRWWYCSDCEATWKSPKDLRRDEICPRCRHNGKTFELHGRAFVALEAAYLLRAFLFDPELDMRADD